MKKKELLKLERAKDQAILDGIRAAQRVEDLKGQLRKAEFQQQSIRAQNDAAITDYLSAKLSGEVSNGVS